MTTELSRRALLAGAAAGMGTAAFGQAPDTTERPLPRGYMPAPEPMADVSSRVIDRVGLTGVVTYALIDLETGALIDGRLHGRSMPPASTMKAITALYALERLGPSFRFSTQLLATGPIEGGRLRGDLILAGGGDPTLDTDKLAELGVALREAGVNEVEGAFYVWAGALPEADRIDDDQPEHVGYNPAYCGLNLNFNRVHFEWKPRDDTFDITMQARGVRFQPSTNVARMAIVDRQSPVFDYAPGVGMDSWSVARWALGKKDGARWLPVRFPALYAGDVFRTLARSNGVVLPSAQVLPTPPEGRLIASVESEPLVEVLRGMMRYSTNLTAEACGLTASMANGVPVRDLVASGSRMAGWAETSLGVRGMALRDHSGLGYASEISASAMAGILRADTAVRDLMRPVRVADPGRTDGKPLESANILAKTGTLNFVSTLAGYLTLQSGRPAAFAIFTADTGRRDAIPPEQRERPRGSRSWANRSRNLQKALLAEWATRTTV